LGGTLFRLNDGISLHGLWDSGVGLFKKYPLPLKNSDRQEIAQFASTIMHEYPPPYFSNQVYEKALNVWAQESFNIAHEAVYSDITEHTAPSAFYINRGQIVSQQQLALAGYRLAILLNQIFDQPTHHWPGKR
jgi:hypothetical protein